MVGTKAGAKKAKATLKSKLGDNYSSFFKRIGAKGGKNSHTGGFASFVVGKDGLTGRERASKVGRIGGLKSTRAGIKK